MFITNGFRTGNEFWRYLLGSAFIILVTMMGGIPFTVALQLKYQQTGVTISETTMYSYLGSNTTLFLLLIPNVLAMLAMWIVIRHFHQQSFLELTTARPRVDWGRIGFSFCLWAAVSGGMIWAAYMMAPADFAWNFNLVPFLVLSLISLTMIPFQAGIEEYVFRGYLMQGFALLARNRWFPLAMTSVLFGLMHIANPEVGKLGYIVMAYYVGTGLFLGIITLMDDGMELSLGFHAANNIVAALLLTSDWTALQTHSVLKDISDPEAGWEVFFPLLVVFPLLLVIFSKRYKWSGWKHRLTGKIE